MSANFKDIDQFEEWCTRKVFDIYYASISMNDDKIRDVVDEIRSKMHVREGNNLIGINIK